jgi:hypothetical protein
VEFKMPASDELGYAEGLAAGTLAREQGLVLTLYQEVGIDDYARGFRAGFFNQFGLTGTFAR